MTDSSPVVREEMVTSPSLYLGDTLVTESSDAVPDTLRSGRRAKETLFPLFFWFLSAAPAPLAMVPFRLLQGIGWLLYPLRKNLLRQSCEFICTIASRAGHEHSPREIYGRFLRNIVATGNGFRLLLREGMDEAVKLVNIDDQLIERTRNQLSEGGGAIVCSPHNVCSLLAAMRFVDQFPFVLVYRNSPTIRRTRLALGIFERMRVRVLMVRGSSAIELSRAMFAALRDRQIIVATVDNAIQDDSATMATMFGQEVGFPSWAAKIAAKKKAPVIPSYYRSRGDEMEVLFGEPLVTDSVEEAVQHNASFFERQILTDPASWAYLADRKWHRVLRRAAESKD